MRKQILALIKCFKKLLLCHHKYRANVGQKYFKTEQIWFKILNVQVAHFQVKNEGNVRKVNKVIHEGKQPTVNDVLHIADF